MNNALTYVLNNFTYVSVHNTAESITIPAVAVLCTYHELFHDSTFAAEQLSHLYFYCVKNLQINARSRQLS